MSRLELFPERPFLIGVVHLLPTPGSPRFGGEVEAVLARAVSDARALAAGGCDGMIVENFGDAPFFVAPVPAETVAALALAVREVRRAAGGLPVGVNVLRNDARSALGLCASAGAAFLRVNVHTGAMVTDQGVIEGRAAETLRERSRLAPRARILADVFVKHATPLGAQTIGIAGRDCAERGLADALVVTGDATGTPADAELVGELRDAVGPAVPILVGSGVTPDNAAALLEAADGAIVGTALKEGGRVAAPVEERRVRELRAAMGR